MFGRLIFRSLFIAREVQNLRASIQGARDSWLHLRLLYHKIASREQVTQNWILDYAGMLAVSFRLLAVPRF